jgi:hypothetical protein
MRLETDTELYTDKSGKLMWSGLQVPYRICRYTFGDVKTVDKNKQEEDRAQIYRDHALEFGRVPEQSTSDSSGDDCGYRSE